MAAHPSAQEIKTLTLIYLEARFGKRPLDEPARRTFEQRVKAIRLIRRVETTAS